MREGRSEAVGLRSGGYFKQFNLDTTRRDIFEKDSRFTIDRSVFADPWPPEVPKYPFQGVPSLLSGERLVMYLCGMI